MAEPAWVKTAQRLNTVCPYFTMFPLDFPLRILRQADIGDRVLDPFCGRGTTLFAARQVGLGAVGIDINPVAAAIAEAKVAPARAHAVSALAAELLTNGYRPQQIPAGSFWELAYHRSTLVDICRLREQLGCGAVIISDTFGRPWREGLVNVAIGCAGSGFIGTPVRGTCRLKSAATA